MPCPSWYISHRKSTKRILMKFAGGNHYHNRLSDYILGQVGVQEQESRMREKIRIDVDQFCRNVKEVLRPSKQCFHRFHCT